MENEKKPHIVIIAAVIGALALMAVPFISRWVDINFPKPTASVSQSQEPIINAPTDVVTTELIPTLENSGAFPVATSTGLTRETLDKMLGRDNWFCVPDRQDLVGVKKFPQGFVVGFPFGKVDASSRSYGDGQTITGGSGNAWLLGELPLNQCPSEQQAMLAEWIAKSNQPITRDLIDSIVGGGNWSCTSAEWNIAISRLPSDWVVQYPFTSADFNSSKFGVGQKVTSEVGGTLNMVHMPREQCP